jgi:hypothetical protein
MTKKIKLLIFHILKTKDIVYKEVKIKKVNFIWKCYRRRLQCQCKLDSFPLIPTHIFLLRIKDKTIHIVFKIKSHFIDRCNYFRVTRVSIGLLCHFSINS